MKIQSLILLASTCFFLAGTQALIGKEVPQSPSLQFATIVEKHLTEMTATNYQHKTEIDEQAGVWKCDCSGLIGHILRRNFPEAYLHVDGPSLPGRIRPLSANYCETFLAAGQKKNHPWKPITRVQDLRPGDIFAWKKTKIIKGKSTGHTFMIASIPKLEENGLYSVRVVDSTGALHDNDTRPEGTDGVGTGDMWLSADEEGRFNGFKVNKQRSLSTKHILAAGRIQKVTGPSTPLHQEDRDYLQLEISAAKKLAEERSLQTRIIAEDGEVFSVSRKIEKTRLNFVVASGKIIRVVRG